MGLGSGTVYSIRGWLGVTGRGNVTVIVRVALSLLEDIMPPNRYPLRVMSFSSNSTEGPVDWFNE